MIYTIFQAPEPSSFGEEDFEVYFIFEPKTPPPPPPRRWAISDPKATHHSNKLGRGPLGKATYQISRP